MMQATGELAYTARDVKAAAGLTYRQLNDWDAKGVVAGTRAAGAGWRRFSGRSVFALMVCSEIRRRFGTSVDALRFVRQALEQPADDHFGRALGLFLHGGGATLLTDLRATLMVDRRRDIAEWLRRGPAAAAEPAAVIVVILDPLIAQLMVALAVDPTSVRPPRRPQADAGKPIWRWPDDM
jgi:hypothetical protein